MIAANLVRFVGCNKGWAGAQRMARRVLHGSADGHGGAIRAARYCALPHPAARDDCISSSTAALAARLQGKFLSGCIHPSGAILTRFGKGGRTRKFPTPL